MSELDLFTQRQDNTNLTDGYYSPHRPISVLTGNAPVDFYVPNDVAGGYLDLFNSMLYIKCKIINADRSALTGAPTVDNS